MKVALPGNTGCVEEMVDTDPRLATGTEPFYD